MNDTPQLVFSTEAYRYMSEALCAHPEFEAGQILTRHFPDGERYMRLETGVDGRDVIVLGGTVSAADTLELYDLATGVVRYGARRLTLVIPYFGYSTMERAVRTGEIITAKSRARLLSSISTASSGNRVILLDLHVEGIAQYFEDGVRPIHVRATPLIMKAARQLGGEDFVLGSADTGRAKWVEALANDLGVSASFVFKKRLSGDETKVTAVSAQCDGAHVIMYDDMIRTGGSLIGAARAYQEAGARRIDAIATHGVLPEGALERLRDSGIFQHIITTDSHPRAQALAEADDTGFLQIVSVADLLADDIRSHP
ncbi:MAG: ribose-phosphate diphosphokinase [Bradymonadia bacterium]